jgi:hypothetical protein
VSSDRPYLEHGSRHTPVTGSDPIPTGPIQAVGLPSAVFTKTIGSPITDPAAAQDLAFDTVQTPNPEYFSIASGHGTLATGFYLCVGRIQFQSVVDWHTLGGMAALGFTTAGVHTFNMATSISIAANPLDGTPNPTYMNYVDTTDFIYITGSEEFSLSFVAGDGLTTFPSGIAVVSAGVVRISGFYSITI